ncbi:2Fe-2S iron-sulfur cluster-binding protein [Nonomuraea glycinis]|uniref:2Fe-2S iron-sulfur cluster-binding protein n=1 Tax=Nonomuraea glycinis TaxID=2047744 RepID=UPI001E644B91|nr:2Fe-2S iron-sulfur cluster-binding protein [Nonomuraea glycinis]
MTGSCREGVCGTCETHVLDGEPDHARHGRTRTGGLLAVRQGAAGAGGASHPP